MTLQDVIDRLDIVDLLHRYATGLDSKDWELLASVFTDDGVADFGELGGEHSGPAAIVGLCRGVLAGLDWSQHIISNEVITVDGARARTRCYLQAQHVFTGTEGGDNYLVGGMYEDELVRTPQGWRIRHRTLIPMWSDGNPKVFEAAAARLAAAEGRA